MAKFLMYSLGYHKETITVKLALKGQFLLFLTNMTATAHSIVGAYIAHSIGNQPLGLSLAFLSHFIFDLVPHWDLGTNWKTRSKNKTIIYSLLDSLLGIILSLILFSSTNNMYILIAAGISQLPDYLSAVSWFWGIKVHPFDWIAKEQELIHARASLPMGLINQIIVVLIVLVIK